MVLDDDKITRLLARKQIAKFGPHPSSIVLGGSRQEALSVPDRVRTLAREVGEENVVVILDQNLTYPDGDVLGTDLAAALRRARLRRHDRHPVRERGALGLHHVRRRRRRRHAREGSAGRDLGRGARA